MDYRHALYTGVVKFTVLFSGIPNDRARAMIGEP